MAATEKAQNNGQRNQQPEPEPERAAKDDQAELVASLRTKISQQAAQIAQLEESLEQHAQEIALRRKLENMRDVVTAIYTQYPDVAAQFNGGSAKVDHTAPAEAGDGQADAPPAGG